MPISVQCNDCGKRYKLKDEARGRKFRCKECGTLITVGSKRRKKRPPAEDDDFSAALDEAAAYEQTSQALPPRSLPPRVQSGSKSRKSKTRRRQAESNIPWGLILGLSGGLVLLLVLGIVALISTEVLAGIFLVMGGSITVVGAIWFLVEAFRESPGWGVGCFFCNIVYLAFLVAHFDKAWKPFVTQIAGFVLIGLGGAIGPEGMLD